MFTIDIKSFTKAQKAAMHLQKHGVRCIVERAFARGSGCGFRLRITDRNADRRKVCALLSDIGIDCGLL